MQGRAATRTLPPHLFADLWGFAPVVGADEIDSKVIACGALEIFTENLGEVRSLVVSKQYEGHGLGKHLVQRIVDEARQIGLRRIMALTYVPEFFYKLGFHAVSKDTLPEKVWGICVKCYKFNACDETAVLLEIW